MSVSSIQGLTNTEYTIEQAQRKKIQQAETLSSRNTGPDTVSFSQDALSLLQKDTSSSTKVKESENQSKTQATNTKKTQKASSVKKKSIFSMLLESIFLNDIEKNESLSNQTSASSSTSASNSTAETKSTMPTDTEEQQKISPIKGNAGEKDIIKTLNKAALGKANLSDMLTAISSVGKSSSGQTGASTNTKTSAFIDTKDESSSSIRL